MSSFCQRILYKPLSFQKCSQHYLRQRNHGNVEEREGTTDKNNSYISQYDILNNRNISSNEKMASTLLWNFCSKQAQSKTHTIWCSNSTLAIMIQEQKQEDAIKTMKSIAVNTFNLLDQMLLRERVWFPRVIRWK